MAFKRQIKENRVITSDNDNLSEVIFFLLMLVNICSLTIAPSLNIFQAVVGYVPAFDHFLNYHISHTTNGLPVFLPAYRLNISVLLRLN